MMRTGWKNSNFLVNHVPRLGFHPGKEPLYRNNEHTTSIHFVVMTWAPPMWERMILVSTPMFFGIGNHGESYGTICVSLRSFWRSRTGFRDCRRPRTSSRSGIINLVLNMLETWFWCQTSCFLTWGISQTKCSLACEISLVLHSEPQETHIF